ncbi:GNAT family N-acetyltransferase [Actinopolymorpha alba]|uniref:GNAT family N-acetyltransferase n=1 Tax=Actinopolymorpha alba TaxID=533267 RepID=UPI000369AFD4|nr:GNAT family N-acetyltransferase [Actinopolymorpha alba]
MSDLRDEPVVWRPSAEDLTEVARVFSEASFDEAVFSWVIPDERFRRRRVETGLEQTATWLGSVLTSGGEILAVGDQSRAIAGVSLWERLQGPPEPPSEEAAAQIAEFLKHSYGEYAPRMAKVFELTAERHPYNEPHLYLQTIVVVPESRGLGLGGALIRNRLAEADAEAVPVYLESSTPRNRKLYERLGFVEIGDPIELPDDGPALTPMWRSVPD